MTRFIETLLVLFGILGFVSASCIGCAGRYQRFVVATGVVEPTQYRYGVMKVETTNGPTGDIGITATGFAVTPDHILTAGHFCKGVRKYQAEGTAGDMIRVMGANPNGSLYDAGEAEILAISDTHDLCLLYLNDHGFIPFELADDTDSVNTEDKITVIGAPSGTFPVRREGHVVAVQAGSDYAPYSDLLLLSIDIQPGCSGSPIIWGNKVIGLLVIMPSQPRNAGLAERVEYLHEFLVKEILEK